MSEIGQPLRHVEPLTIPAPSPDVPVPEPTPDEPVPETEPTPEREPETVPA